jgi:hypothetical protein
MTSAAVQLVEPSVIDLGECPPPLNDDGRAGWPEITALQVHVIVAKLTAELARMKAACALCDHRERQRLPYRPERRPTPRTVVEAVLHTVRERGPAALHEPKNLERLRRCDAMALAQIDARLAKLKGSSR